VVVVVLHWLQDLPEAQAVAEEVVDFPAVPAFLVRATTVAQVVLLPGAEAVVAEQQPRDHREVPPMAGSAAMVKIGLDWEHIMLVVEVEVATMVLHQMPMAAWADPPKAQPHLPTVAVVVAAAIAQMEKVDMPADLV
jgi:hypothetical protein